MASVLELMESLGRRNVGLTPEAAAQLEDELFLRGQATRRAERRARSLGRTGTMTRQEYERTVTEENAARREPLLARYGTADPFKLMQRKTEGGVYADDRAFHAAAASDPVAMRRLLEGQLGRFTGSAPQSAIRRRNLTQPVYRTPEGGFTDRPGPGAAQAKITRGNVSSTGGTMRFGTSNEPLAQLARERLALLDSITASPRAVVQETQTLVPTFEKEVFTGDIRGLAQRLDEALTQVDEMVAGGRVSAQGGKAVSRELTGRLKVILNDPAQGPMVKQAMAMRARTAGQPLERARADGLERKQELDEVAGGPVGDVASRMARHAVTAQRDPRYVDPIGSTLRDLLDALQGEPSERRKPPAFFPELNR